MQWRRSNLRVGLARTLVLLVLLVLTASGCTGSGHRAATPANGCSSPVNERLDPRSTIHLFSSTAEPRYLTDPPTSGPHRLGPPFQGVVTSPIPRPSQVAMLESGYVILQSRGLSGAQLSALDALAGDLVTVAPPAGALPSPVVATAWTWKLECGSAAPVALGAVAAFVTAHRGVGFSGNIATTTPAASP
jgi:hypothetical protein